jgi:hypothetical protein
MGFTKDISIMANTLKLKNSNVENKSPADLEYGEIALNYKDGNIYYKNVNNDISEMKRLDSRLNEIDVTSMTYDPTTEDLTVVVYASGNKIELFYDVDGDLEYVDYYAVDTATKLFTQALSYDGSKNLIGTIWSVAT